MAYFARIKNGIVDTVIVAEPDVIVSGVLGDPKEWREGSMDESIRKNPVAQGFTYDASADAFIPPQPYPSWTLQGYKWVPPVPKPVSLDVNTGFVWNENLIDWIPRTFVKSVDF